MDEIRLDHQPYSRRGMKEVRATLPAIVDDLRPGSEGRIIITRHRKPVAMLVALSSGEPYE